MELDRTRLVVISFYLLSLLGPAYYLNEYFSGAATFSLTIALNASAVICTTFLLYKYVKRPISAEPLRRENWRDSYNGD